MWHTFLERKFNALSKTVSIITVALKLTKWQLIFRGVFWPPVFLLRRRQRALENWFPLAQFFSYRDVTHIFGMKIQCPFQSCKYNHCSFKIDQMATDFSRRILAAVFHLRRQKCASENRFPRAQFLSYRDVTHIFETEIQCRFQNCKYHHCSFKIGLAGTDFSKRILAAAGSIWECRDCSSTH